MQNNYEETENVLKEVQSDYKEKQNDVLSLFVVMLRLSQSCRGCLSVSLIAPQMRRMHEREARESSCVCRAAGGPPALTLAARSARLLIPLSGCRLPCLPSLPPPFPPLDQVIRNLQKFLVLFALSLHSLTSRHQGK